jgi:hypothetical protein
MQPYALTEAAINQEYPGDMTRRDQYETLGYTEPIPTLSIDECQTFKQQAQDYMNGNPTNEWPKGLAPASKIFYDLAMNPKIIDAVTELIGDDIILWGSGMVTRPPGFNHPWHSDIESALPPEKTCTAWIAIENVSFDTSLQIIPYSHKFDMTIQECSFRNGKRRGQAKTDDVVRWAQEKNPECFLHQSEMNDGEVQYFDGHIWHHSNNTTDKTRLAVIMQYAEPSAKMRRTDMRNRLDWPLVQLENPKPPCLLVKGQADESLNRFVQPPVA